METDYHLCYKTGYCAQVHRAQVMFETHLHFNSFHITLCFSLQIQSPMNQLYKKVFPAVLQLACDVEQVARQLFEPLVMQLIHWFSGRYSCLYFNQL